MTRLHLRTGTERLVVGYGPDLTTYYVEAGSAQPADPTGDPDEGLETIRGRTARDLPDLPGLVAELRHRRAALNDAQLGALIEAGDHHRQTARTRPRRR